MIAVTDRLGRGTARFGYGPFGEVLYAEGADAAAYDHRFNGQARDALSGLDYYGARYYDPLTFSWTQEDPMYRFLPDLAWDEPRRMSPYTFSLNNPLRYIDPDGRDPKEEADEPKGFWEQHFGGDESHGVTVEPGDVEGHFKVGYEHGHVRSEMSLDVAALKLNGSWGPFHAKVTALAVSVDIADPKNADVKVLEVEVQAEGCVANESICGSVGLSCGISAKNFEKEGTPIGCVPEGDISIKPRKFVQYAQATAASVVTTAIKAAEADAAAHTAQPIDLPATEVTTTRSSSTSHDDAAPAAKKPSPSSKKKQDKQPDYKPAREDCYSSGGNGGSSAPP